MAEIELAEREVEEACRRVDDAFSLYMHANMDYVDLYSALLLAQGKCRQASGQIEQATDCFRQMLDLPRISPPYRKEAEEALSQLESSPKKDKG